jgi:NADP-dependent 3-hydroxy acid dehydrogenase YdfG
MRVWFITGASRGFGALITREALAAGDAVVATARNPKSVQEHFGGHPHLLAVRLDVTQETQAHTAAEAAVTRFGQIDILLNNAGFGLLGAVEETTQEEVARLYATNVFGLLAVTRAVLPHCVCGDRGTSSTSRRLAAMLPRRAGVFTALRSSQSKALPKRSRSN